MYIANELLLKCQKDQEFDEYCRTAYYKMNGDKFTAAVVDLNEQKKKKKKSRCPCK